MAAAARVLRLRALRHGLPMASASPSGGFGGFRAAAAVGRAGNTVGTEREIVAAERALVAANRALDAVCEQAENDSQAVVGIAAELKLLQEKLAALGAGSAMEQVERKLAVARAAVEKLGRSDLSSIKTMKQPPPTIKRVITAVYCLLNAERVVPPRFDVEWAGGPCSCQGLLGRRDFTQLISSFDASELCEHPELVDYVSTNFIGEETEAGTELPTKITASRSAVELSPASSPVRAPSETANVMVSKSVLFGRRAGTEQSGGSRTPSPSKGISSLYAVTNMATVATRVAKTAQSRREKRNAEWAEIGYSDKVAPRRLTYDEVAYASKACGALYQWASTAIDTAKALQKLYPVKKQCDALNAHRDRVQQQLSEAEATLDNVMARKTSSEAEVRDARAELARLQAVRLKLRADAEAKLEAVAAAAAAKEQAEPRALAATEEQAAKNTREREEHERQQCSINEAAYRRQKAREAAVARAAEKIQVTKVDVVIKQSLTFEKGKVVVEDMAIPALIAVAQVMKDHNECKVNVRGRPDPNDGDDSEFRVRISRERAKAVCDWLVSQGGVAISRLRTTTADDSSEASDDVLDSNWSALPRHCWIMGIDS